MEMRSVSDEITSITTGGGKKSRKRMMTEGETELFVARIFTYDHGHSGDVMKDVAYYILDLLRQGYTVKGIIGKLKYVQALTVGDHRYGDCIIRFSQAIRLCRTTQEWVAFHLQRVPKAQEDFTLQQFYPNGSKGKLNRKGDIYDKHSASCTVGER